MDGLFTQGELDKNALEEKPIRPEWVLEGTPAAKAKMLAGHTRGWGDVCHWACTAGKFRWHYDWDETVVFVEGEVKITDDSGKVYYGKPGISLSFPAGTSAVWEVSDYIRKVAFNHKPVPWYLHVQSRIVDRLYKVVDKLIGKPKESTGARVGAEPEIVPAPSLYKPAAAGVDTRDEQVRP